MKLSELISAIGDDNVRFQNLDQCGIQLDWSRKSGGKITFGTPETIIPGEGTERLGLIVWLDRKAAADAVAAFGTEGSPASEATAVNVDAVPGRPK